jgi:PmbA protein
MVIELAYLLNIIWITMDKQELITQLCQSAKQKAKHLGLDAIELSLYNHEGFSLEVRQQELDALSHHNSQSVTVTVYHQSAKGRASGSQLTELAMHQLVEKAADIAKVTQPDPAAGLAPTDLLATDLQDLSLYHPWDISIAQATTLAVDCEAQALALDPRLKQVEQAWVDAHKVHRYYSNSAMDRVLHQKRSSSTIGLSVIAEANDEMVREHAYTTARDPNDLKTTVSIAKEAVDKTVSQLGARSLSNRQAPILFMPEVAKSLWGLLVHALSGRAIYQESSFLTGAIGKMILPANFSLGQNPYLLKGMGSTCFDDDGVQTRVIDYIKDGILDSYILSQYSANRLAMSTTGNCGGVFNLAPSGPSLPFADLVKQLDTGLIVTEMMGQGVDLATGSFSKGVNGFWVENGVIQHPVHQTSIAGNLSDMLKNIIALADDDIDQRGAIQSGSMLLDVMAISGV